MHGDLTLSAMKKEWHGSLKAYVIGFFASLILTTGAFALVISEALMVSHLHYTLAGLALVQAVFQLIFFLHVGQERAPRWETAVFCLMFLILIIVAGGSLWIMNDLNDRMILDSAVQGNKVMQDFELESLSIGVDHSQKVKATHIESDYSLKGCVNLLSSTAESRMIGDMEMNIAGPND